MPGTLYHDKLDWNSLGYFAEPTPPDDPDLRKDPDRQSWLDLEQTLDQAKQGNFRDLPALIDIYRKAQTAVLQYVSSRVLGDAGTEVCFQRMADELHSEGTIDGNKVIHYCSTFRAWGSLSCVPLMVDLYQSLRKEQEAAIIPINLSSMLESEWGPISNEPPFEGLIDYCNLVLARYHELKALFQTDGVLVYNGEVSSVGAYAKCILAHLTDSHFDRVNQSFLRRRFESSTGINCSGFYKKKRFQPLAAAAIVEEFLQSPEAKRYEEGVRYFFGHPVPFE